MSYAKNIIYRDIVPRYAIRNSESIEWLFFYLISNAGAMLNYTTLAITFELSDKTIKEYIHYLEETFLLERIDRFHTKPKERIKSMKKVYVKDNGFLQMLPKLSSNLGAALENAVFNTLMQKHESLTYLKDTYEIDFYTDKTLYQVSYDIREEKTKKRELNAFGYFKKSDELCKLITFETDETIDDVEVISFERFALV